MCVASGALTYGGLQQRHVQMLPGERGTAARGPKMVVCAEVAKSCSNDDVTTEAGEVGGRPCNPVVKRERGCGGPSSHNTHTHVQYSNNQNILKHTRLRTQAYFYICVHTETRMPTVFLSLSLSLSHSPNTVVYCAA